LAKGRHQCDFDAIRYLLGGAFGGERAQITAQRALFSQERRAGRALSNMLQPALARRGVHQPAASDLNDDRFKVRAVHNSCGKPT
jgi:hypothetical protein